MPSAKKPPTPMLDELAAHDERVGAASQRARELVQSISEHGEALERLKGERIEAYAAGDEKAASALKEQSVELEAQFGELLERREGADIATRTAQRERDKFVAANHVALVAEREPLGRAAVKAIMDATAALVAGVEAWQSEASTQVFLLRSVAGRTGREVPDLPVAQLVRDLRRAVAGGVPAPLPEAAPAKPRELPEAEAGIIFEELES